MEILLDNRQKRIEIETDALKKTAERLLDDLGCSSSTILSLSLVDSDEMAELNLRFRGKERPTNVLAFSQKEGEDKGLHPDLLGDVVISTDRAAADALQLGYTNEEMIAYLLIHGVLHLVGHHHDRPDDEEAMRAKVDQLFTSLFPQ